MWGDVVALALARTAALRLRNLAEALRLAARGAAAELRRDGEDLVLTAQVQGRFQSGYLSVTWFNGSAQLAQDSVYLDTEQREATFRLRAPEKGAYRAALGLNGTVMRLAELYEVQP